MTETTGEIDEISGLSASSRELLEATGVLNLLLLAQSEAGPLHAEIQHANSMLELTDLVPSDVEIEGWIQEARNILNYQPEAQVVRLENVAEPLAPVRKELLAIPIPVKHMVAQKIAVNQVPAMESFVEDDEIVPELLIPDEVPVVPEIPVSPPVQEAPVQEAPVRREAPAMVTIEPRRRLGPDAKKPFEERELSEKAEIAPLKSKQSDVRKAPSVGLNVGKKPHSRGYIRGVLYPQPVRIRFAAIISIVAIILLPFSFVAGILILLGHSVWLLAIPGVFLIFGLLYLMFAKGMRCRICGQPIFAPKACRKHIKAHHIPVLGYILPTSLQLLFYSWFRCIYCGTSVRVKE